MSLRIVRSAAAASANIAATPTLNTALVAPTTVEATPTVNLQKDKGKGLAGQSPSDGTRQEANKVRGVLITSRFSTSLDCLENNYHLSTGRTLLIYWVKS